MNKHFYSRFLFGGIFLFAVLFVFSQAAVAGITFSNQSTATFPSTPFSGRVQTADFDNDGDTDILYQVGTSGSEVRYGRSNGNGTFTVVTQANSPFAGLTITDVTSTSSFPGDYDGDGDIDLLLTANNTTGTYLRNDGAAFSSQSTATFPSTPFSGRVQTADFDNDGDTDILYQVDTSGSEVRYGRSNGNGTFTIVTQANSPFAGLTISDVVSTTSFPGDYDGDGDIDLLLTANNTTGTYLRNDGAAFSSQSTATFPLTAFSGRVEVGDFDSDGDTDILYQVDTSGSEVRYGRSNGNGTFTIVTQANSPFAGLTITDVTSTSSFPGDYDGDGDIDLLLTASNTTGTYLVQGSNTGGDGSPPTISSTTPADNATGVIINSNITIVFDEVVTKGTGSIVIVRTSDNSVFETIDVNGSRVTGSGTTYTINPTNSLAAGTAYAVRVNQRTFVDSDGAVFSGTNNNTAYNFTTGTTTNATATISGKVTTAAGRGIRNARITISDDNGQTRVVTTGLRGTYRIEGVPSGATLIVQVSAKRFVFAEPTQAFNVSGDTTDTNFVAQQ